MKKSELWLEVNGGVGVGAWELVLKGMKIVWRIGTMGVFVCWGCGRYGKWLEVDGGVGVGGAVVWEWWYGWVIFCLVLRMVCFEDD